MEFKKGDKVRITKKFGGGDDGLIGKIGFLDVSNISAFPFKVDGVAVLEREIELVEEPVKEEPKQALRFNGGKTEAHTVPMLATHEVAKVSMIGACKYDPDNWRKPAPHSQYFDCIYRHLIKYHYGEDLDQDIKCHHLACIAWNAMAELEHTLQGNLIDDRPEVKLVDKLDDILQLNDEQKEICKKFLEAKSKKG